MMLSTSIMTAHTLHNQYSQGFADRCRGEPHGMGFPKGVALKSSIQAGLGAA